MHDLCFRSHFHLTIKLALCVIQEFSIIGNYSGRYNVFAKHLNANGYKAYGMDWIGK